MAWCFLLILLVMILTRHHISGAPCRFALTAVSQGSCIFPCRCTNGCDTTTGACVNGGQCADGHPSGYRWLGTACQEGNIAHGKSATQSIDTWGGQFPAGRAVDGDTNPSMAQGHCAHPDTEWGKNAWWVVDLADRYNISRVTIYNRDTESAELLDTFVLSVGDSPDRSSHTQCASHSGRVAAGGTVESQCRAIARYVSFRRDGGAGADMAALCEVVLIGHRHIPCAHCPSTSVCNDVIGCDVCATGKQQPDCIADCEGGTYGKNCGHVCGHCKDNVQCDIWNGTCAHGCEMWYMFDNCKTYISTPTFDTSDRPDIDVIRSSSVTVKWPRARNVTSGLESHYYYIVWMKEEGKTYVNITKQPHASNTDLFELRVTGLQFNTQYTVVVESYRQQDDHSEAGARTGITRFTTSGTENVATSTDCVSTTITDTSTTDDNTMADVQRTTTAPSGDGCDSTTQMSGADNTTIGLMTTTAPSLDNNSSASGDDTDAATMSPNMANTTTMNTLNIATASPEESYNATDRNACTSNPCMNGATCIEGVNTYSCKCVSGYTGDMCETDINDCENNECNHGATCTDGLNGYSCECADGYEGGTCETNTDDCKENPCKNGGTCEDGVNTYKCLCKHGYGGDDCADVVNQCAYSPCQNGATCSSDSKTAYNCSCPPGYTGNICDTEIITCSGNPCRNDATCTDDSMAGYICTCADGYAGNNCDADVDECASNPCLNGGKCVNKRNRYECLCLPDLFKGTTCDEEVRHIHYQYGYEQGDVALRGRPGYSCDWTGKSCASDFIQIPKVQIFSGLYKRVKIYSNGYATFGLGFESRYPDKLSKYMLSSAKRITAKRKGIAMLFPLWTDNDAIHGNVFYHIYDLTKPGSTATDIARVKHAIAHAKADVLKTGGVSVTDVSWVMVVTWHRMRPRMYYNSRFDLPNTFQLVIAYDASRYQTFTQYIYIDMGWDDTYLIRRSMIGHMSYIDVEEESLQLAPSMKSTAFRLDTRTGNTGEPGRYMFTVASARHDINYDQMCYSWFANEMKRWTIVKHYWSLTLFCPCDMRLAEMDGRWRFDWKQYYETNFQKRCLYERIPLSMSAQECCYTSFGSLITTEDGRGGQTFFYHPRYEKLHHKFDVLPKQWCCDYSDNCEFFYWVRPVDHCRGYVPLTIGWFYGDPHIRTLDGFQYTFNGLGEYTLIETTQSNFTLQGRTAKARDANGTETAATVFSAFAARDIDSDTVHVGMDSKRVCTSWPCLVVFVENSNVSDWFITANISDEKECTDVILTKTNTNQILVSFKSGFSLTIGVSAGQLDITVAASEKFKNNTKGLMGVFNGDSTDDLLPPGDNANPLSNSSTEKTIFNHFGEMWRIQRADSLLFYASGESYSTFARTDFKPLFLEDVYGKMTTSQKTHAKQTCGDNKECFFDFALTGKEEAAAATLSTNAKNEKTATSLANRSPNIIVDSVFNITVGQINTLTVSASDPDGDDVIIMLNATCPPGAVWNNNIYTWEPANTEPVHIAFKAEDGKGGVAAAEVTVNMCNCSKNGECLFDRLADGFQMRQTFRLVQCNCSVGWEGDHCESDLNGCQDRPCTAGTNCTDLTPQQQIASGRTHNCSECPSDMEDKEGICLPINECDPDDRSDDCEQICVDEPVKWSCACHDGYRLTANNNSCADIDECSAGTSGCEQQCENTNGKFICSCVDGYHLEEDNKTCTIKSNMRSRCDNLSCKYGCKQEGSHYECMCPRGYRLNSDGKSCDDVNECTTTAHGCKNTCTNVAGGFNCSCSSGFKLMNDKKSCKLCRSGTWGKNCAQDCKCKDSDTACDATTGCTACPAGVTGGECDRDIDECESNPCDAHSKCINVFGTFKCVCHAGYTQYNATKCQDLDECRSDPCLNGADCKSGNNSYSCTCLPGYSGNNCETDVDECASAPCQHTGTCRDLTSKYRCLCARGYRGKNCENEIPICDSKPCMNNGVCGQEKGDYICHCVAGYGGLNCESDIDECACSPCMNGGICEDQMNKFICNCTNGFTGSACETGIIATLPVEAIARIAIKMTITNERFLPELKNKKSDEYKQLKTKVVKALEVIIDKTLGKGKYEIIDVTFSEGSVVVNYVIKLPTSMSSAGDDIVNAINEAKGTFGEFKINSVEKKDLKHTRFYGQLRVPYLAYSEMLADEMSMKYKTLADNVKGELKRIYYLSDDVGSNLIAVTDVKFKKGSVIVVFSLWVDSIIENSNTLRDILVESDTFEIMGYPVDRDSIKISDTPIRGKDFPWLAVTLGTGLSVVVLVLVVILVIFIVRKARKAKIRRQASLDDAATNFPYSPTATNRQMFWQQGRSSMSTVDPVAIQRDKYDRERMQAISKAVGEAANIDWSLMEQFSRRNAGQHRDLLHRNTSLHRSNDQWPW